jgi:hypothetical protein
MRMPGATRTLLAWLLLLSPLVARADEGEAAHRHDLYWYGGWATVVVGAAATLTGTALTTHENQVGGVEPPGLSPAAVAGWVMVAVGTATWIAGVIVLKIDAGRKPPPRRNIAFDWHAAALRF